MNMSLDYNGLCQVKYAYGDLNIPYDILEIIYIEFDHTQQYIFVWSDESKQKFLDKYHYENEQFVSLVYREMKKKYPNQKDKYLLLEKLLS